MKPKVSMREALTDPNLFGDVLAGESWAPWRAILIGVMGEALKPAERKLWRSLTGRDSEPAERVDEFWAVVGRRGGKTRAMSVLSAYLAALVDWSDTLVPGERGKLLYLGQTTEQAKVALGYAGAIFKDKPLFAEMLVSATGDTLALNNRIDLEVRAASFRSIRSFTAIGVVADELAFWLSDESANPDAEILAAVRPALATTGGPLLAISSPYAQRGELYTTWRKHYGPQGDRLIVVAHGASRTFNPSLKESVVKSAMARDPASAAAEYLAQFRTDVEAFMSREAVEAVVAPGVHERAPAAGITYAAFVDPSGGRADSMTLAVAHAVDGKAILDAVRERQPPFSPETVVEELATLLRAYGLSDVTGDRWGAEWTKEAFRKRGIEYRTAEKNRSELYRDLLPAVNSGSVELLAHPKLISQLVSLERRTARGGRDSIDHAPGAHDDVANAVAGAIDLVSAAKPAPFQWFINGTVIDANGATIRERAPQSFAARFGFED